MSISLPERTSTSIDSLTPREIVAELDKYVVGQAKAKRAVAIALGIGCGGRSCRRSWPRTWRPRTS